MRKLENAAGRFCDIVEEPDTCPYRSRLWLLSRVWRTGVEKLVTRHACGRGEVRLGRLSNGWRLSCGRVKVEGQRSTGGKGSEVMRSSSKVEPGLCGQVSRQLSVLEARAKMAATGVLRRTRRDDASQSAFPVRDSLNATVGVSA